MIVLSDVSLWLQDSHNTKVYNKWLYSGNIRKPHSFAHMKNLVIPSWLLYNNSAKVSFGYSSLFYMTLAKKHAKKTTYPYPFPFPAIPKKKRVAPTPAEPES